MKNSLSVQTWRKRTKERLIKAFSSQCGICGYNKCIEALHFHHINPAEKKFTVSASVANVRSWDSIVIEARKCVLLCANCHAEVHCGITAIPRKIKRFDERYAIYRRTLLGEQNKCPVCGKLKATIQVTCSRSCAGSYRIKKIDWSKYDLAVLLKDKSMLAFATELGISSGAVAKRVKKIGLKLR